jgi:hypothetical protein
MRTSRHDTASSRFSQFCERAPHLSTAVLEPPPLCACLHVSKEHTVSVSFFQINTVLGFCQLSVLTLHADYL